MEFLLFYFYFVPELYEIIEQFFNEHRTKKNLFHTYSMIYHIITMQKNKSEFLEISSSNQMSMLSLHFLMVKHTRSSFIV